MTAPAAAAERDAMREFWEEHSQTATVEEMMLDSKAAEIDTQERPEVWAVRRAWVRRSGPGNRAERRGAARGRRCGGGVPRGR